MVGAVERVGNGFAIFTTTAKFKLLLMTTMLMAKFMTVNIDID